MAKRTDLLIIDPQVDFCISTGALFVPGATEDMGRLASMVTRYGEKIKQIHVTLDCHYIIDVAHPAMWVNSKREHPSPFTLITADDIRSGKWLPFNLAYREHFIKYCDSLASAKKYVLIIWPPHCLIGTPGNNVIPVLMDALIKWQLKRQDNVDFVSKGSNPLTEHYSAVKAEYPIDTDPSTQINTGLLQLLPDADEILLAGEAGSHCWKSTVEDIVDWFEINSPECVKKLVMLEDAVSPVPKMGDGPDFPAIQRDFVNKMKAKGMKVAKTTDF